MQGISQRQAEYRPENHQKIVTRLIANVMTVIISIESITECSNVRSASGGKVHNCSQKGC